MKPKDKVWIHRKKEVMQMKIHRFWAWATCVCMFMVFYTGYKHK